MHLPQRCRRRNWRTSRPTRCTHLVAVSGTNLGTKAGSRAKMRDLTKAGQEKSPVKTGLLECGRGESNSHSRKATRT